MLRKRRKRLLLIAILLILLVPYGWSRWTSESNRLRIVADETLAAQAVEEGARENAIRVVSYNIAHGRGLATSNWDGGNEKARRQRLQQIAELLIEIGADVVVLNEVDFDSSWSYRVNQAEYLGLAAGYPYRVEQRNLDFRVLHRTWRFGNTILSRHPISSAEVIELPEYAGWESTLAGKKRGVSCDVRIGSQTVRIIGLHLSHRSEEVREVSAQQVRKLVAQSPFPCVVLGDMNSTPTGFAGSKSTDSGANAMDTFFDDDLLRAHRLNPDIGKAEMTFRSDRPASVIDWILVSREWLFESSHVSNSLHSDHRPVVADIRLPSVSPAVSDE